jgi:acetyltransferase-like isoleucine patch superfamily enzyme
MKKIKIAFRYFKHLIFSGFYDLGWRVEFNDHVVIDRAEGISIGNRVKIDSFATVAVVRESPRANSGGVYPVITIGDDTGIGKGTNIFGMESVEIGRKVMIAPNCFIGDYDHQFSDVTVPIVDQPLVVKGPVVIGEGSWIGANSTVCSGVTIGKNSVVGANSVVTKDIPDYSVAVGAPARVIKQINSAMEKPYKLSVTIGIPAYNEGANIGYLLENIFLQKCPNFFLEKIIIISDASTDNTVKKAAAFKDDRVKIIENKERLGKPESQNKIINNTKSDILVILDADIRLKGVNFLSELIKPFELDNMIGMTGADTVPAAARTYVARVISDSHVFKNDVYRQINLGNNIYTCHGRGRAFAKKFYSRLKIPADCSQEDAYTYLECVNKGFKFRYAQQAKVIFGAPVNINDHAKQSSRFVYGQASLKKYFDKEFILNEQEIPKGLLLRSFILFVLKNPVSAITYVFIQIYIVIFRPSVKSDVSAWNVSLSTKLFNYEK